MTGQIDMNEPLPLIVINEESVEIVGRVFAHFKQNPYVALEWLCTKHARLDNLPPLYLMNYGRYKKILKFLNEGF
jgi:hypothetical protein